MASSFKFKPHSNLRQAHALFSQSPVSAGNLTASAGKLGAFTGTIKASSDNVRAFLKGIIVTITAIYVYLRRSFMSVSL
jgi:hypothetical protein